MKVSSFPLEEEYKKPTGITPDDIAKLREWLNTQPHLPSQHITDLDLIVIYHRYGRSIEVAKQEIDNQYTLRTLFKSFFSERTDFERIQVTLTAATLTILPKRSKEGHTIFYARWLDNDLNKFNLALSLKSLLMVIDLWQYEEGTWPSFMLLMDMELIKFGLIAMLDVESIRQFVVYVPDALLVKLKAVHFVNVPPFMDRLNAMTKHFMNKEFNEMITVHPPGDLSGLASVVDIDILPKELGGKYKSALELRDETIAKVKANQEYFAAESKKRVQESLRPGKPKTITDIFGSVEGSFKQLQID